MRLKFKEDDAKYSLFFFPFVGLLLGAFVALFYKFISNYLNLNLTSFLSLLIGTLLTAGIHLDGLADLCDALASRKREKNELLSILHDPSLGYAGAVSLFLALLYRYLLYLNLKKPVSSLASSFCLSRLLSAWAIIFTDYIQPEGKAAIFYRNKSKRQLLLATLFSILIMGAVLNFKIVLYLALGFLLFFLSSVPLLNRKFNGLSGDIHGALIEISELIFLSLISILL